jgi:hypothetical protein
MEDLFPLAICSKATVTLVAAATPVNQARHWFRKELLKFGYPCHNKNVDVINVKRWGFPKNQ